ncbi:murein biosynthesis integral membrane protein MurJ [Nitrospirillum iridis]|uniref:Probable lipid II flippase MurJ n=1 Tax=Nitrospirillum iridis TaxID=765888 RepID=A0A7X0B4M6_9PROT|nr:murein biosynthesis integral membrane protein MurJ [Nitrospirillum iridis]MBB6254891.1 putative peptidoglycan lipid II flippase [Nitrospirillum iridis]
MSFARATATVGGLTLISRVGGFFRDLLTAWVLGAGVSADIFIVAQRLPNYFRSMFAEGAFTVSFVPMYSADLKARGRGPADQFADQALSFMVMVLLPVTALVMMAMPWVMLGLASGYADQPDHFTRLVDLGRITFPYLIFISITALQTGVLNALGRFAPGAAAPIAFNICMIAALGLTVWLHLEANLGQAWGLTISGMVQMIWLAVSCHRAGVSLRITWPRLTPDLRRLFRQMVPGAISASVIQINLIIGTHVASLLPSGSISYLYYADRLNQLPLGVIGIAIGTALLPTLSRHVQAGERDAIDHHVSRGIEFGLLLALPAAFALGVVPEPIYKALFHGGRFGLAEAHQTALALAMYAPGIPAYVASKVLTAIYFAHQDTRTPMRIAIATLAVNMGLATGLALFTPLAHLGIALASTITAWGNITLLSLSLVRRSWLRLDRQLLTRAPRILAASLVMVACLAPLAQVLDPYFVDRVWVRVPALAALVMAGLTAYGVAVVALRGVVISDFAARLRRRRK